MSKRYRAVVVGAGQMGAGKEQNFISHAHAFKHHPRYDLVGICDPHRESLDAAERNWETKGYSEIHGLMKACQPDVVSICSPDQHHAEHLKVIAAYSPKVIIMEKPANVDIKLANEFTTGKEPFIAVNYTRRYLPIYHQLNSLLAQQVLRAMSIRYAKGLIHNGSHAIDLIRFVIGEITHFHVLTTHYDYLENDPSVSVHLKTERCHNILLQALDQQDYTHFEVDIFTNTHRYVIHSDHQVLSTYSVKEKQGIPQGKRLVLVEEKAIEHQSALLFLLDNIVNKLEGQAAMLLDLMEAFKTEKITRDISACALKVHPLTCMSANEI